MRKHLIVNADDFGLSPGVNRGIIRAHEHGVVTSASLMVRWPAAEEAAAYGRKHPSLSLGLHCDLGEWACRNSEWVSLYEVVPMDDAAAVGKEIARQLDLFRHLVGRDPTHLDSHQHVHRTEPARSVLVELGWELDIPVRHFSQRIHYGGDFYGQGEDGATCPEVLSVAGLRRILASLQPGITEICCHPGEDEQLNTMYGRERAQELEILCDGRIRAALDDMKITLCSFAEVNLTQCKNGGGDEWAHQLSAAMDELKTVVSAGQTLILVDENQWASASEGTAVLSGRHAIPFLESNGQYWGPPPDDETAISELGRLRECGSHFIVFAWPAFWWLEYYSDFCSYLRSRFRCVLENDRLVVFDLRSAALPTKLPARTSNIAQPNDPDGWEKVYLTPISPVARLASPVARTVADLTFPGEVLLEAGCGSATLSAELATEGRRIELCDFSNAILERAAELFRQSNLPEPRRTLCDLTRPLPWPGRAVDVVWSSGVLEHWTDEELRPIVSEMARVSRRCVISLVPYAGCVFYRLGKHLAEASGKWPYGRELPRRTLRPVFEKAGLREVREFTVWNEWGPKLLGLTDKKLESLVLKWWDSLPSDDPAKLNQGYLLLTVGYCAGQR